MNEILLKLNLIGSDTRPIIVKRETRLKSTEELNVQLQLDIPQESSKINRIEE